MDRGIYDDEPCRICQVCFFDEKNRPHRDARRLRQAGNHLPPIKQLHVLDRPFRVLDIFLGNESLHRIARSGIQQRENQAEHAEDGFLITDRRGERENDVRDEPDGKKDAKPGRDQDENEVIQDAT